MKLETFIVDKVVIKIILKNKHFNELNSVVNAVKEDTYTKTRDLRKFSLPWRPENMTNKNILQEN